ncbi:phosphodiesterase [Streptomyces sp. CA-294286]|uniref:phosphodiesterase n=1 Tax=Streptomyces sp. CA-294286 TaxID=3240070 RepID=UPI003D8C95C2
MNILDRLAFRAARAAARSRGNRRALHPAGVIVTGRLVVPGHETSWQVPWLDAPGSYPVTARWSLAAGLPRPLPDALGLALRVEDADGPGRCLELLLTSSGRGRWTRHLPFPRTSATRGPYTTLLPYEVGGNRGVVAAFPVPGTPRVPVDPAAVGAALTRRPAEFVLCVGKASAWLPWGRLVLQKGAEPFRSGPDEVAFDPYAASLPGFRPVQRLESLRVAAYAGSREGRRAAPPA